MAHRYDSRTTIFSPAGRLFQVEYAMEAISHTGACIGVLSKDGIVLVAEKKVAGQLLDTSRPEKLLTIDGHVGAAVAGMTADANVLVQAARTAAQRYLFAYQEPVPIEYLVRRVCDVKQSYTQFGGLRPYGVAFLYAGWDKRHGFQLYQSDPSGNYTGWHATAIGNNSSGALTMLRSEYQENCTLEQARDLAMKVLAKTVEAVSLTSDKIEVALLSKPTEDGPVEFRTYNKSEVEELIKPILEERDARLSSM
ncbi:hypothetical protein P9112_006494 [Eukaryota sp. TZLM1-RC]